MKMKTQIDSYVIHVDYNHRSEQTIEQTCKHVHTANTCCQCDLCVPKDVIVIAVVWKYVCMYCPVPIGKYTYTLKHCHAYRIHHAPPCPCVVVAMALKYYRNIDSYARVENLQNCLKRICFFSLFYLSACLHPMTVFCNFNTFFSLSLPTSMVGNEGQTWFFHVWKK